jgi:chromosome segregation ATPase
MSFIAIRGSLYLKYNEMFIDNAFVVNTISSQPQIKTNNDVELSDEEKARRSRMNKWKDCNIFTCKNPNSEADYEAWLKSQKDKLNKYLDKYDKKKNEQNVKKQVCPSRISLSEWNEDILTEDEKEAQERLEEIQDQEDELNQRIKQLQQQLADQERDFAMNAAAQQQALNELENAKKSQKDMKFYETAVNMHVRPWQEAIKKVEKKVTSYEKPIKSIKDLLKKIDELRKKVESISSVGAAPPKKKKRGLGSKIKSAFK